MKNNNQEINQELKKLNAILEYKINLLKSYEKTCGRDRWFNRYCQDINDLKKQISDLGAKIKT